MAKAEFGRILRSGVTLQCFGDCKGKQKEIEHLGTHADSGAGSGLKGSAGGVSVNIFRSGRISAAVLNEGPMLHIGEGAGGAAGGIAGPGAADRHPPLRLWLDPVVTTAMRSARDYAVCGRCMGKTKLDRIWHVCPRSLGREII